MKHETVDTPAFTQQCVAFAKQYALPLLLIALGFALGWL